MGLAGRGARFVRPFAEAVRAADADTAEGGVISILPGDPAGTERVRELLGQPRGDGQRGRPGGAGGGPRHRPVHRRAGPRPAAPLGRRGPRPGAGRPARRRGPGEAPAGRATAWRSPTSSARPVARRRGRPDRDGRGRPLPGRSRRRRRAPLPGAARRRGPHHGDPRRAPRRSGGRAPAAGRRSCPSSHSSRCAWWPSWPRCTTAPPAPSASPRRPRSWARASAGGRWHAAPPASFPAWAGPCGARSPTEQHGPSERPRSCARRRATTCSRATSPIGSAPTVDRVARALPPLIPRSEGRFS